MTMPIAWLRWLVTLRRHPSAFLLIVQLAGILLYPVMEDTQAGRALFGAFGILVLSLALWVVNRSAAVNWIAWSLAVPSDCCRCRRRCSISLPSASTPICWKAACISTRPAA
jgi:hypothetical protein